MLHHPMMPGQGEDLPDIPEDDNEKDEK